MRPRDIGGQLTQTETNLRQQAQNRRGRCREPRSPGKGRPEAALSTQAPGRREPGSHGPNPLEAGAGRPPRAGGQRRRRGGQFLRAPPAQVPRKELPQEGPRAHPRGTLTGPRTRLGADRLAHRAHPRLREAANGDLRGALPGDRALAPGRGGWAAYRAHLRAHPGGPLPLRKEPLGGRLPGARARKRSVGRQGSSEAHLQGGRRDAKEAPGKRRPLRPGSLRLGLGPETPRREDSLPWGKTAKKRAVVATARKLSVLLHSLWMSGEVYEPLRNAHRSSGGQAA